MLPLDITFFVPCYNESANVENTIRDIECGCAGLPVTYEILVVDDGSTDRTAEIAREHIARRGDDVVRLHQNGVNRGLGYSYWYASTIARGARFMVVGGDNELPPDCIREVVSNAHRADVVIPYPVDASARPLVRRVLSDAFIRLFQATSGHGVRCVNTPMLLPTSHVAAFKQDASNFGYLAELMCDVLCKQGVTHCEIPVSTIYRNTGKTTALKMKNFAAIAGTFVRLAGRRIKGI